MTENASIQRNVWNLDDFGASRDVRGEVLLIKTVQDQGGQAVGSAIWALFPAETMAASGMALGELFSNDRPFPNRAANATKLVALGLTANVLKSTFAWVKTGAHVAAIVDATWEAAGQIKS